MRKMEDTIGKTENFATRHVKLITFLICLTVFLALAGPWSVFRIVDWYRERNAKTMTVTDVVKLSEKEGLALSDITSFRGDASNGASGNGYTIQFDHYILQALQEKDGTELYFCQITDIRSGETVDLLNGDVKAFFENSKG